MLNEQRIQILLRTGYAGRHIVQADRVESTMIEGRELASRGAPPGTACVAEEQVAGRGRAGRIWVSPPDVNLYATFVLYPPQAVMRSLSYVTPLAIALALEEAAASIGLEIQADLKWPNDVQVRGKKVAGVLIETATLGNRVTALVGIGINVNLQIGPTSEIVHIATSLKEASGVTYEREAVLAAVCNHLEGLYEQVLSGETVPFERWRERLVTLGQHVMVKGPDISFEGKAVDVEPNGALVVETPSGRQRVEAGDVTLRLPR